MYQEKSMPQNVINLGSRRDFTDDEFNMILGRRRSGVSYPEKAKDNSEFSFYEKAGFREACDSRLLYKMVEE
jgi:hypothetical protein